LDSGFCHRFKTPKLNSEQMVSQKRSTALALSIQHKTTKPAKNYLIKFYFFFRLEKKTKIKLLEPKIYSWCWNVLWNEGPEPLVVQED